MSNEMVVLRDELAESGYVVAEVFLSPLPGTEPMRVKARIGSLVRDILPDCARAPMVCIIDGVPMKREWWMQRPVCEGDRIQFAPVYLGGGGGSRSILGAIAMIVVSAFAGPLANAIVGQSLAGTWVAGVVRAGIILVGSALISAVIGKPNTSLGQGDSASSVYSVDTQGNAARVFQPIPVQYGRMKYFPNYAAQPYVTYHTSEEERPPREPGDVWGDDEEIVPDNPKSDAKEAELKDGEQFYYALFCLGQGHYDIESIQIADAAINSFDDVWIARILEPGEKPKVVNPCVVSSDAVAGVSLDKGDWVGPFPCCGPGRRTTLVEVDLIFPQGLCKMDDKGKAKNHTVSLIVQASKIDDAGYRVSGWEDVYNDSISASSLTPQRRTLHFSLNGRYQVRMKRIGKRDEEDNRTMDLVQWGGLRGYLDSPAPLCETATHFELVMRASEQLSSLSQRKISILATRKLTSWDSDIPTKTQSPARALWDKWTNSVYGDGMPRERIDVDMLRHFDEVCDERGDKFDYVFENRVSSQEADQTIAKSMRSVALQRQGVKTVVRDELCDLPLTLFNPTNIVEKSVSLDYVQITEETTDGVIAEYFSNVSWDWEEVECPGPGRTYSDTSNPQYDPSLPVMENPARITLAGITSRRHAEREGLYYAYTNALRRQFATWTTELQGALVYYGAPVLLSTTLYASQQGGEIREYDAATNTLSLTNGIRPGKLVLMRPDGSVTDPLDYDIVDEDKATLRLHQPPDFSINYGDYASERTKYVILEGDMVRRIVKILSVTPKGIGETGAPLYELKGVVDVPEVHTVDNFLLGPDDNYIPPIAPDDPDPDEPNLPSGDFVVKLRDIALNPYCLTYEALYPNTGHPASIVFYADGALRTVYYDRSAPSNPVYRGAVPGQEKTWNHWVEPNPPIQNIGHRYEIMFVAAYSKITNMPRPSDEYLNNPERPFMQGHKLNYIARYDSISGLDSSTASVLSSAHDFYRDEFLRNDLVYTNWMGITNPNGVWLKGQWDSAPVVYPSGSNNNADADDYFVAIRDVATHSVQVFKHYRLGIWRHNDYH